MEKSSARVFCYSSRSNYWFIECTTCVCVCRSETHGLEVEPDVAKPASRVSRTRNRE